MKKLLIFILLLLSITTNSFGDCVWGAKDKTYFTFVNNHTIILKGGLGSDILIKTYCTILRNSNIQVLKDNFCSYESSVLYIDGEVCDVNQVESL